LLRRKGGRLFFSFFFGQLSVLFGGVTLDRYSDAFLKPAFSLKHWSSILSAIWSILGVTSPQGLPASSRQLFLSFSFGQHPRLF
jgi:hypothetical protein